MIKKYKNKLIFLEYIIFFTILLFSVTSYATFVEDGNYEKISNNQRTLNNDEVVVYNYTELKTALSEDNGYTYIYLGADITQSSTDSGIIIHNSKSSIVIDGLAPDRDNYSTFTQNHSTAYDRTIRIDASNITTKNVTLKNMKIVGDNYHGVIFVPNAASYTDVVLEYDNIEYTGPQITYNRYGTAHYKDSNIIIQDTGGTVANEVAEATNIILSGDVNINRINTTGLFSVFWISNNYGSLTLNPDANVNIYTTHYLIYADYTYKPDVILGENSKLTYEGKTQGFTYTGHFLNSLTLKQDAMLDVKQTTSIHAEGLLRIKNSLKLESGSSLILDRTGTGTAGYAIQFTSTNAVAEFNDPKRVKIHAPSKKLFYFNGTGQMNIITDSVNLWSSSSSSDITIDDKPTNIWNKALNEKLEITANISGGVVNSINSNLIANDPTENLTTSTFLISNSELLTIGRFNLATNKISNLSTSISGVTENNAAVKVKYDSEIGDMQLAGIADGENFNIPITAVPTVATTAEILSFSNDLNKVEKITVIEELGVLKLKYIPSFLDYGEHTLSNKVEVYMPINQDSLNVEIEDTRGKGESWYLSISGIYTDANTPIKFVYIDGVDQVDVLSTPITIKDRVGSANIRWDLPNGIGMKVSPGEIYSNREYTAKINWTLSDAP